MNANGSLKKKIFVIIPAFLVLFIFAGMIYIFYYYFVSYYYVK